MAALFVILIVLEGTQMMNTPLIIPAGTRVMVLSHVYRIQYSELRGT